MPTITFTALKNAALDLGYSPRRSKQLAKHITTAPWFPYVVETLTMPSELTYADPTGEEAVHNVLMEALMKNSAAEVAA